MWDNRLIRLMALEAMEMRVKVRWLRDLEQSLRSQVERVSMEDMGRLSLSGTGQMLRDSAWRAVKGVWEAKAQEHSKLSVSWCVDEVSGYGGYWQS